MNMSETVTITVNEKEVTVSNETIVASAVIIAGFTSFRKSVTGDSRAPICGMGICFECRVTIDGVRHSRSCQTLCREGMTIETE
jgi:D-hydroxyproline dehydrogenase subunit gamma